VHSYLPRYLSNIICCSADHGWNTIRHPSGWQYHWHRDGGIVVDRRNASYKPLSLLITMKGAQTYEAYEACYSSGYRNAQIIDHEHQAATVPSANIFESNPTDDLIRPEHFHHRHYWKYMWDHPAHHLSGRLDEIIGNGVPEALEYLDWCSQGISIPLLQDKLPQY
jgi:hypothetical protein